MMANQLILYFVSHFDHCNHIITNNQPARRSLVILSGDARYRYKHSISKDFEEMTPEGGIIHREKRISFTFREIIAWEDESKSCK